MMETCGASGRGSVKGDKSLVVFGPPDAQPTTRLRLSQPAARNPVEQPVAVPGGPAMGAALLIDAASSLTLDSVRIANNRADASGDATHTAGSIQGGIVSSGGPLVVRGSTFSANLARSDGGYTNQAGGAISGGLVYTTGNLSVSGTTSSANTTSAVATANKAPDPAITLPAWVLMFSRR